MSAAELILGIAGGIAAELLLYLLLRRLWRVEGRVAALVVALAVLLFYIPWATLHWPGGDVFAIHLALYLITAYILAVVGGGARAEGGRRWHWAPALIVAFFGFVVAVNVVFLGVAEQGITGIFSRILPPPDRGRVADSRFPGTVSHDFQQKEAQYNAYLQQVAAQRARGWRVHKGWLERPQVGRTAVFLVEVEDAAGRPLQGAEVRGRFLRTSNSAHDFDFEMQETGPGHYRVETRMPLPGLWQLVLDIRKGEARHEIRATTSVDEAG